MTLQTFVKTIIISMIITTSTIIPITKTIIPITITIVSIFYLWENNGHRILALLWIKLCVVKYLQVHRFNLVLNSVMLH